MPRTTRTLGVRNETFEKLKSYGTMGESWDDLLNRLVSDLGMVNFELLTIDGTPANTHIVEYQLGNARYKYSKGEYALVDVKT